MMMKRTIISCLAVLLMMVGAKADNLTVEAVEIEPGATTTVGISLTNTENNLVSFQMDLTLPEGISLNKANCVLTSRITDVDQELVIGKQGEHVYRLTSASFNLTPIAGTNGELITLSITAANTFAGGLATISNIVFANRNSETINIASTNFNISVPAPASPNIVFADANVKAICVANWDTNHDGELSEAEAAAVTDLGMVFKDNYDITSFNELQYFTGLTSIGDHAFDDCTSLSDISIPNQVTSIGEYAFAGCVSFTSFTIPNGVTSIGSAAFLRCTNLLSIVIVGSVTNIGSYPFADCICLESIVVENTNPIYDSRGGCNAIIETATNKLIAGCKNTIIPNSVTSIGYSAFIGCSTLTTITIPYSVVSCEELAFSGCNGLETIIVENGNTKYDSRENCNAIIETASNTLIAGCKSTVIPNSVTSIGGHAFSDFSSLMSITIPNSVTHIGEYAFAGCSNLESVALSDNLIDIGGYAFYLCTNLLSINIPNKVTTIGEWAFGWCSFLTSVVIPQSVTTIGYNSFEGCPNLTSVTVGNPTPVAITQNTFSNRANATLYVPAGSKPAYEAADYWKDFNIEIDGSTVEPGDANGDGETDVDDASMIIYFMLGRITGVNPAWADINGDGDVDILDATLVIYRLLGRY